MSKIITWQADKLRVTGPKVDGSYTISFDSGEYTQDKVAELVAIPQNTMLTVTVEVQE